MKHFFTTLLTLSFFALMVQAGEYGDVNGDNELNISDINAIIDCIFSQEPNLLADVNDDGEINISDINAVLELILNGAEDLPAPTLVKAEMDINSIKVSWQAVDQASDYSIYISNNGTTYNRIASGVTECVYTDDHPLLGQVSYKVMATSRTAHSKLSEASNTIKYGEPYTDGIYLGCWGFNSRLYTNPVGLLDENTLTTFTTFNNWLKPADGSVLYYAVDNALNCCFTPITNNPSSITLVTFTDGFDHGSTTLNNNYGTQEEYLEALTSRISSYSNSLPFRAYTIGLPGDEITTDADKALFQRNVRSLATDEQHAFVLENMNQVNEHLQEIARHILADNVIVQTQLKMIREDDGTRIRFTFDNIGNNALQSQCYIEGTFGSDNTLRDIVYHGVSSTSGTILTGTVTQDIFVTYTLADLKLENGLPVPLTFAKEFVSTANDGTWRNNSEFSVQNRTTNAAHRKAVVLLAMDCSSSLSGQFNTLKASVNSFIETLANCKTVQGNRRYDYASALTPVQFYTNHAIQNGGWRSSMAMGDWTRYFAGGNYWHSSYWYPVTGIITTPYQWWFIGAYGGWYGLWSTDENLIDIYDQATRDKNYAYAGVARVMRAYGMMAMTDLYGEMPYSDVTKGCGIGGGLYRNAPEDLRPKYDNGRTIFMGCIDDIEQAIELLEQARSQDTSLPNLAQGDNWNHGDLDKWIKLAYLLKARWLNHLIKKEPGSYKEAKYDADEILRCLDKAMHSNADNTIVNHTDDNWPFHDALGWDEPVDYSPLFSVSGMNAGYMVTKMLYDNLTNFAGCGIEDPRADHIIPWAHSYKGDDSRTDMKWTGHWRRSLGVDMASDINADGGPLRAFYNTSSSCWYINSYNYNPERLGDTVYVEATSDCKGYFGHDNILYYSAGRNYPQSAESGSFYTRVSSPSYIGTYAECCFIRAEVLFKRGNKASAFAAYREGVKASCELMNDKLRVWVTEDPALNDCPSFTPMSQQAIDNYLDNGIGDIDHLTLGHILTQKRIALMFSLEIWNDMRRYDFDPDIFFGWSIPAYHYYVAQAMQAIPDGKQFRRWRQSSHEHTYNSENLQAIGSQVPGARMTDSEGNPVQWNAQDDVWTIPVWWDSDQP